jgi:hypothetical protein
VVLAKTVDTVTAADEATVNAALTAYNALGGAVKALLSAEKALLDSLKAKIGELQAGEAAAAFRTTHAVALAKTVDTVRGADNAIVDAALTAYAALSAEAKALLSAEKTLLDSLKAKIPSGIAITLAVHDDGSLAEIPDELVISKSYKDTLTVRAADDLTALQWSLNGVDIPGPRGTAGEITFEAASYLPGFYTLGLRAARGGVPYSINITFVVDN